MANADRNSFPTRHGYMTDKIQRDYIYAAMEAGVLPADAHRMPEVISLTAPTDPSKPVQFWQLYSILGQEPIVRIVSDFYQRVFDDEDWFTSVFAKVGDVGHHINTQASMWIDVMGGGPYYHGAEFRLSFHHAHNAHQLMTDKGAERWSQLMLDTLNSADEFLSDDPRVRISINTFLAHFMGKYAREFSFENRFIFGETNPAMKRKINFLKMTTQEIEALSETEIATALTDRGVDVSKYDGKPALVNKALMM